MNTCKHDVREQWLLKAIDLLIPCLKAAGAGETPKYRVSCGWPLGKRPKGKNGKVDTIGQCFGHASSADGTNEIFISPALADVSEVLATLLHELVHAFVGIEAKHGKDFAIVAKKCGLEGKMTATVAGVSLKPVLADIAKQLGPYPHAVLGTGYSPLKPKQSTRMIKVQCPACEYQVRTSRKWLEVGTPKCPCGIVMIADNGGELSPDDESDGGE